MTISKEQLQAYIDNEGKHCPYCESDHGIDNFNLEKKCLNPKCKKEWEDIIQIISIDEQR